MEPPPVFSAAHRSTVAAPEKLSSWKNRSVQGSQSRRLPEEALLLRLGTPEYVGSNFRHPGVRRSNVMFDVWLSIANPRNDPQWKAFSLLAGLTA